MYIYNSLSDLDPFNVGGGGGWGYKYMNDETKHYI